MGSMLFLLYPRVNIPLLLCFRVTRTNIRVTPQIFDIPRK